MLKKTIQYKDLDGNPVEGDFYFNLSKAEIAEMEVSTKGGLAEYLREIIKAEDGGLIIAAFREIIQKAVGKRHEDGRQFLKNEEIRSEFMQSDAFSELFMELVTDADAGSKFIRGIVPADMVDAIASGDRVTDLKLPEKPAWMTEDRVPTPEELVGATPEQLKEAFRRQAAAQN